ncbi:MAG: hypothetical protein ABW221_20080 [Vicinamibacteria bacterium]
MSSRSLFARVVLAATLPCLVAVAPATAQPPGLRLVKDTNPGPENSILGRFAALGNRTLFAAYDPVHGEELWVSDGTTEGTRVVKDIDPNGNGVPADAPFGPVSLGSVALFSAETPAHGRELWRTDGSEAGTSLVKDIAPGSFGGVQYSGSAVWHGALLFCARGAGSEAPRLWRSDGTTEGTYALSDLGPDWPQSFRGCQFAVNRGRVLFTTQFNRFLWSTDGTAAGTSLVKDMGASALPDFYDVPALAPVGRFVYFVAPGPGGGYEVWRTDGSAAGTVLVKDVAPGSASSAPVDLRAAGPRGLLTFTADDGVHGFERWVSDGTPAGTRLLADIDPGPNYSVAPEGRVLAELVGGRLLFSAYVEGVTGFELWTTDGTPEGTSFLTEIWPGAESGLFDWVMGVVAGGHVYFPARDPLHGLELWRSDGTAAGTELVEDFFPGGGDFSSGATPRLLNGSTLFVTAWHWETGWELYAYDVPGLPAADTSR